MSAVLRVLREAGLCHFRDKVTHLILHVTNRCNLRCRHCFIDFSQPSVDLPIEIIRDVAAKTKDQLVWLDIGGGEPFLRKDLAEIVSLFGAKEISIPTNGWHEEKILRSLEAMSKTIDMNQLILTISIDGFGKTHDHIRQKEGCFEHLIKTFRAIRQRYPNLRVKFNTVLSNNNVHEITELFRFVQTDLQPTFHSLLYLRGTPQDPTCLLPSAEEIESLEAQIRSIQDGYSYGRTGLLARVQRNYQSYKRELDNAILAQKTQVIPCLAGRSHAVIYADGKVAPCELLPTVSSLHEATFDEILKSDKWAKVVSRIRRKACYCTHDCNMLENVLYHPASYPRLLK